MLGVLARIGLIVKTDTEDLPALLEPPIMLAEICFQPERVNSFRGKGEERSYHKQCWLPQHQLSLRRREYVSTLC